MNKLYIAEDMYFKVKKISCTKLLEVRLLFLIISLLIISCGKNNASRATGWDNNSKKGGFQYNIELDTKHEDDLILEKEGNKVFIDSTSLPFLTNATIDFSEELIGARFIIDNPNASSSCGCGTSFSI